MGQGLRSHRRPHCVSNAVLAAPPGIAREKNDPLAQGRILPRQDGVEGWPVQDGHLQVTDNHVIVSLLELGQGVPAMATASTR